MMETETSTRKGLPDSLPLEFQAYMGVSGRISIPRELRSDVGIYTGDIMQITILAKKTSGRHWVELKRQLTTSVKVQKRHVIRVPEILKRAIGFWGGRDVLVRLEKVVRGDYVDQPRSKCVYIRKRYIDDLLIKQGDIIQATVVGIDDTLLSEGMQLTVTTRMQKNTAYIPNAVTSFYGNKGIRVRVDKAVYRDEIEGTG